MKETIVLDPDQTDLIAHVAQRLRALADESRIRILLTLKTGPHNVGALGKRLGIGQASISKHLAVLKAAGLVECTQQGTQSIHRIADEQVFDLCALVCGGVVRHLEAQQAAVSHFRQPMPDYRKEASHDRNAHESRSRIGAAGRRRL